MPIKSVVTSNHEMIPERVAAHMFLRVLKVLVKLEIASDLCADYGYDSLSELESHAIRIYRSLIDAL